MEQEYILCSRIGYSYILHTVHLKISPPCNQIIIIIKIT